MHPLASDAEERNKINVVSYTNLENIALQRIQTVSKFSIISLVIHWVLTWYLPYPAARSPVRYIHTTPSMAFKVTTVLHQCTPLRLTFCILRFQD